MLEFYVAGQSLKYYTPVIAADSLKFLTAQFHFIGDEWDGYTRWAHFRKGETVYDIALDEDDRITEDDALNLTAGEWDVYMTGTKDTARLTTVVVIMTVKESGLIDAPLHVIPQSVAEQIDAKAAQALAVANAVKAAADAGKFNGKSFEVKGYYDDLEELAEAVPNPAAGESYGIGTAAPYHIYIWDGANGKWVDNGTIQGPQGDPGAAGTTYTPHVDDNGNLSWTNDGGEENPETKNIKGPPGTPGSKGDPGESAYDAAKDAGYTGTEATFYSAVAMMPSHHERHLPDGADPITIKEGNIADGAVSAEKIKDKNVTAAKLADECKNIIRESVALAASAFVSDTTIEGARYKAELAITGCTAAMLPIIAWTAAQSEELEVKRIQSAAGKIIIYSADAPGADLTIPTVALISPIGTGSSGTANYSGGDDTGTLTAAAIIAALGYTPAKSTDIPTVPTTDISANTEARHTHSNKSVLDQITGLYSNADAGGNAADVVTYQALIAKFNEAALQVSQALAEYSKPLNITIGGTTYAYTGVQEVSLSLPTALPNPKPLTLTGGATGSYDGSEAKEVTIPTVPSSLKNPNALTIKAGEAEIVYDGSEAKEINVSVEALDPVWIREQLADMAGDYTEFAPLNAGVAAYLAAAKATYTESDQTASIVANYTSQGTDDPDGLTVDAGASATLEITSMAEKTSWTQPSGDKLYNLIPNRVYKWTGASSGTGKAKATDALRMIRMTGARNVRDLGGWQCDGGIVRYGRIFRGGQLSNNNVAIATAWDIAELKALGVKVELDIRATSEQDRTTSVLGDDVEFISKPTANNAVGLLKNHPDEAVAILNAIFSAVAADKPIYFHCQAGADRTGTIAFVLLALLGVDHVSLDIDYELTSFYDSRKRNASPWPEQWTYINGFTGDSPKEKVTAWALANGITQAQIDAFRTKMIYTGYIASGSGNTTPTMYPVTLTLTNCTSSNEASSAAAGAAYTTTITASSGHTLGGITVTMGGTDISSTAVSGSTVTISNVTGAIVITAAATATPAAKTNLIPTSTDSTGAAFGTNGIKFGTRLNSSGAESTSELSSYPNAGVTGFMPITYGQTIEFENCYIPANTPSAAGASVSYCAFYDANYQCITSQYLSTWYSNGYLTLAENNHAKTLDTAAKTSPYNLTNAKYFRVSSAYFNNDPAIYAE